MGLVDFKDREKEMRDSIRNNIIHPYRNNYKEEVANLFMMADYIFENLGFVDYFFKQVLLKKIK